MTVAGRLDWFRVEVFQAGNRQLGRQLREYLAGFPPILPPFAPDERVGREPAFGQPGSQDVGGGGPELPAGRRPHEPGGLARLGQQITGLSGGKRATARETRSAAVGEEVAEVANTENGPGGSSATSLLVSIDSGTGETVASGSMSVASDLGVMPGKPALSARELRRVLFSGMWSARRRTGKIRSAPAETPSH